MPDAGERRIMNQDIVPLRPRGGEQTALDRVDVAAVKMLSGGEATNLQAARTEVILADLCQQRDQMTTLLADLQRRAPTGEAQIDEVNANLITAINQGVVQIDLFIAEARVLAGVVNSIG